MQSSGEFRRENADTCLSTIIARSQRVGARRGPMSSPMTGSAARQSRVTYVALDCFASLAMTTQAFAGPTAWTFVCLRRAHRLCLHRRHGAEGNREPVPGVDGCDQHGEVDCLRF